MAAKIKDPRFLPDEKVKTDPAPHGYLASVGQTKWWAFAQPTDEENFKMFVAASFPSLGEDTDKMAKIKEHCGNDAIDKLEKEWNNFRQLREILLSIGGHTTCFCDTIEEDMSNILRRGRFWEGRSKMMKGRPHHCHENVCDLWHANREKDVSICTGYALSTDGVWRQHSWLHQSYETATQHRTRIIETTEKRVAYFGFMMTQEECEAFDDDHL